MPCGIIFISIVYKKKSYFFPTWYVHKDCSIVLVKLLYASSESVCYLTGSISLILNRG